MTVQLSSGLPALEALLAENLPVSDGGSLPAQSLRLGLLNLMPDKVTAETQFARLVALSGLDAELVLLRPAGHRSRHVAGHHLARHYATWAEADPGRLDALIVTGAPVETLAFEDVDYWDELTEILDWTAGNGLPAMHVCWAGQAALYHYHGVGKHGLARKQFGIFDQSIQVAGHRLLHGIAGRFPVAVSRHTDICAADLAQARGLTVLAASPDSGLCMVEDSRRRALYVFNHFEYDAGTLMSEYERDRQTGRAVAPPMNCSVDDMAGTPVWRPVAVRLFANWLESVALPANSQGGTDGQGVES